MAGSLFALIVFVLLFGAAILDPVNIGWLLDGRQQDSIQHFVGWEFFRFESWHFPLGVIQNYGYPVLTSVVYTDSIPVLAILFKCFSQVLPAEFQYFGWWYAVCFMLQGWFAWRLCEKLALPRLTMFCIVSFFLLSPIMLNRMAEHQALAAHWVILAGFWLYLLPYRARVHAYWLGLNAITLLIHAYLAAMVLMIWVAFMIWDGLINRKFSFAYGVMITLVQTVVLLFLAWMAGYFVLGLGNLKDTASYTALSMNLLAPFIPTSGAMAFEGNWSRFIATFYPLDFGQRTEGFNYFGLGMLLLVGAGLLCGIRRGPEKKSFVAWLPLLVVIVLMAVYSLSEHIYVGSRLLLAYSWPGFFLPLAEIFRASGRFFWPLYYLVMLATFILLSRRLGNKTFLSLLVVALLLQVVDLSDKLGFMRKNFNLISNNNHELKAFSSFAEQREYKHLVFIPRPRFAVQAIKGFGEYIHFAARHRFTVNLGYFAREDKSGSYKVEQLLWDGVNKGIFRDDTIYVVLNKRLARVLKARLGSIGTVLYQAPYTIIFANKT